MKIKIIVHEAEEGGFWAEVPAIPGCATEGETMDELLQNVATKAAAAAHASSQATQALQRKSRGRG